MRRRERLKRIPVFILLLLLIAALAVTAGCGDDGGENAIEGEGRKITEEQGNEEGSKKFNVEGEQGEVTIEVEAEDFTEETLGVPLYPGAEFVPGSGLSGTTTSGEKENTVIGAEFTTADTIQKVVDWYTEALGEATGTMPEGTFWGFQDQEGFLYEVKVEAEEGRVKITIIKMGGSVDIEL
jgi:hypothetical protein